MTPGQQAAHTRKWRQAAEKAHACRRLKNIGGKGAAVDIEFDAKIAGIGDPGDLITGVENDDLWYESNEYGALCHCCSAPCGMTGSGWMCDTANFCRKRTIAHLRGEFPLGRAPQS